MARSPHDLFRDFVGSFGEESRRQQGAATRPGASRKQPCPCRKGRGRPGKPPWPPGAITGRLRPCGGRPVMLLTRTISVALVIAFAGSVQAQDDNPLTIEVKRLSMDTALTVARQTSSIAVTRACRWPLPWSTAWASRRWFCATRSRPSWRSTSVSRRPIPRCPSTRRPPRFRATSNHRSRSPRSMASCRRRGVADRGGRLDPRGRRCQRRAVRGDRRALRASRRGRGPDGPRDGRILRRVADRRPRGRRHRSPR